VACDPMNPKACFESFKSRTDHKVWWIFWFILAVAWIVILAQSAGFTVIAAEYPVFDSVLLNAPNLTYPHFCIRGHEGVSTVTPICSQRINGADNIMMAKQLTGGECFGDPKRNSQNGCTCFNNYAYIDQGTSKPKYAYPDSPNPIHCTMSLSVGSAMLWVCEPQADGSCGDPYGDPLGSHFSTIPNNYVTFIGLTPSMIRNANFSYNATDYTFSINHRPMYPSAPGTAELFMIFDTFRVFHYFPVDEFTGFRWLLFFSAFTFFFTCIHSMAFTLVRVIFLRNSPVNSGWGPVEGVTPGVKSAPNLAPPPLTQPEGVKGYNTL